MRVSMRVVTVGFVMVLVAAVPAPASSEGAVPLTNGPLVVIAHIDAGVNPYHAEFRDDGPLAYVHPCNYLPGYPCTTPALRLSLNETSWAAAFEKDKALWDGLFNTWANPSTRETLRGKMFWIPGTKIVGAVRFQTGGVFCPFPTADAAPPPWLLHYAACRDYPLLDDHGHGTMTATRMGGNTASQCPQCRIVSIEGLSDQNVKWAADRGWIDVQTNSWGNLVPDPVNAIVFGEAGARRIEAAAASHLVYFASGNGAGLILGWTTWPTQLLPTLVDGAVWVGAHDNGKIAHWSGAPAHVVADGFRGITAGHRNISGVGPSPITCCTSAASPYAASVGAALVLEARRVLGDPLTGVRAGVVAEGTVPPELVGTTSPLADGAFTLDELKSLVKNSAQARPTEGVHDGESHWFSNPGQAPDTLPYGPGGNVFCGGCWTLPVQWTEIPDGAPAYTLVGYGAANEFSLALAKDVLAGTAAEPDRSEVDEFFEAEKPVRQLLRHPPP